MFGLALAGLSGCSLIYNPSNLPDPAGDGQPPPDVMPDSEDKFDADPGLLAIESVFPNELFEGTGTGGSRQGVLTVIGTNIVAGAKVSVVLHAGQTGDPKITIDDAATDVAANGNLVAAPYTLDVNDQLAQGSSIRLDVTVTQPSGATSVTATLTEKTAGADDAVLVINGLDELTGDATPTGTKEFSEVDATSITAAAGGAEPVVIRARGGIAVSGAITANASGRTGGAGGNLGGVGGTLLVAPTAGAGPGGGKPNSGGGGFAEIGGGGAGVGGPASGNEQITTLANPNRSSGGAGGVNGLGGEGGDGGGGGGSIELTAGGDVVVTTVEARGGTAPVVNGNDGGGGSGGLILLRGAQITMTSFNVDGGGGLQTGSIGRSRADTGVSAAPSGVGFRGPMLDNMTPVITKNDELMLTVFGKPNTSFTYKIFGFSGNVSNDLQGSIGPLGTNMFPIGSPLFRGLNQVCAFVPGADLEAQLPEAKNCIEVVYLFTPD
jgi:hypothetical protein